MKISAPPEIATEALSAGLRDRGGSPRLMHLQMLRAVAATLVVIAHAIVVLAYFGFDVQRYRVAATLIGHQGVSAFFVLSGLIMTRQSANRFGRRDAWRHFAYRRLTRIAPLYWIATAMFFLVLSPGDEHRSPVKLLCSLFFIPDFLARQITTPTLPVGWTLNYEMFFYLLFALALVFWRRVGLSLLLAACALLALLGRSAHFAEINSPAMLLHFYTDSFMALFAGGVLIGFVELEAPSLPEIELPVSPAWLLVLPAILFLLWPARFAREGGFGWLSFYSFLVVLGCSVASFRPGGRADRVLIRLGDASYSTYLFHMMTVGLFVSAVVLHTSLPKTFFSACMLIVLSTILASVAGLVLHLTLERPLLGALRRIEPRWANGQ